MRKTISIITLLLITIGCTSNTSPLDAEKKKKYPNLPIQKDNTLWVTINGKREAFTDDVKSIKTFDDCKKAGFKILNKKYSQTCIVGEPYMTNGNYKTFENNPMEEGKKCSDYRYSTCPSSCVPKCTPSSCGNTKYGIACTSDCEGVGGCMEK